MPLLRTLHRSWWLFLPVLAACIGFGWSVGAWEWIRNRFPGAPPVIEYPAVIDLGDRTANEMVTSQFQIANLGGQELVIRQVETSCACGKLHREIAGKSEVVEELRLSPGERADMSVHTLLHAKSAGTFSQTISFLTNDPRQPEGRITLVYHTASGGFRFLPTAVHFGRLLIGQKARQVVDVLDSDQIPQMVTKVFSTDPVRVTVQWIPAKNKERRDEEILLGQVEVIPNTAQPFLLDAAVQIEFADPKIQAAAIQVNGRVTSKVEVTPESVVLPLSSNNGPIYTRNCVVRLAEEQPWRLEVDSVSPGLEIALPDSPKGAVQVVRITWTPSSADGSRTTQKLVQLRARAGKECETIKIPVTCEHQ